MNNDVRIIHGDCLEVMAGMPAGSVDAIVTDPPYGIGYEHGGATTGGRSEVHIEWSSIKGDEKPDGRWLAEGFRLLKEGCAIYLVTRWDVEPVWRQLLTDAGFVVRQRLTWHKRVAGRGDIYGTYAPTCEDVLYASKGRHKLSKRYPMLLDVGCVPTWEKRFHPHQKPISLPKRLIEASTAQGDLVLDPFAGSGTTPVACMKTGRRCIAIELDAQYIPIIERRIKGASTPLFEIMEAPA